MMKQSTIQQSLFFKVFIQLTTNPKLKEMKNNIIEKTVACSLMCMRKKDALTIF